MRSTSNTPTICEPGKRTFHTLIPALLMRNEKPYLAFGSMGGEGQPQAQAALATRIIDFGYDVQQAIEAPRWLMGRTWGTRSRNMSLEGRISDEVVRELKRRGQPVQMVTDWNDNMGHAHAIRVDRENGFLRVAPIHGGTAQHWAIDLFLRHRWCSRPRDGGQVGIEASLKMLSHASA